MDEKGETYAKGRFWWRVDINDRSCIRYPIYPIYGRTQLDYISNPVFNSGAEEASFRFLRTP